MKNLPAKYWRRNKSWPQWLGKRGVVIAATYIKTAADSFQQQAPYSFVVVEIDGSRREFMGCGHQKLTAGDEVQVVLRKVPGEQPDQLIDYRLKVKKLKVNGSRET